MSTFKKLLDKMSKQGMKVPSDRIYFKIPNARNILFEGLSLFLSQEKKELVWLPEYESVANWLSDNQGRGLFLYGNCGRGKSMLTRYVLPAILLECERKVVTVFDIQDMNKNIDLVMSKRIIGLDDIGTEEVTNTFGNKRLAFAEIMDSVEKNGKLVIISTNLQADEIKEQYGDRVLDRIKSTTTRVLFKGNSLRG